MKDNRLYLLHISESLERIEEYVAEGRSQTVCTAATQWDPASFFHLIGAVSEFGIGLINRHR